MNPHERFNRMIKRAETNLKFARLMAERGPVDLDRPIWVIQIKTLSDCAIELRI
ncbi:hypothetical protein KOR42_23220 [Thalassoglobus neptunius]|uniref:Uncharacterized protein n=1 Tax=Thalassoglobus neptunius TaxID=1938619 RepID=A0A5C5X9T4_9PLAN|nr:hypothetical protein KOR42_23220 [Thalassoglobus neptunius]